MQKHKFHYLLLISGIEFIFKNPKTSNRTRFTSKASEDYQEWPEEIPTSPSRSRGHPTQDYPDFSQSLFP